MSEEIAKILWDGIMRIELAKADGMPEPGPVATPATTPKPPPLSRHEKASRLLLRHATQLVPRDHPDVLTAMGDPRVQPYFDRWVESAGAVSAPADEEE
jgi:hypothetical protein